MLSLKPVEMSVLRKKKRFSAGSILAYAEIIYEMSRFIKTSG